MTIDEKLQHFYDVSLDEAREDAEKAIQEHKNQLANKLEEHKTIARTNAEAEVKAEAEHVRREVNKALSAEQITLKRTWSKKQNDLKEKLFSEVKKKITDFTGTPEYCDYLCGRIKAAKDFAGADEVQIYLSSGDAKLRDDLSKKSGVELNISDEDFVGGIRAKIPEKNILIDNSFLTNLETMNKDFKFDGGLKHE